MEAAIWRASPGFAHDFNPLARQPAAIRGGGAATFLKFYYQNVKLSR